MLCCGSGPGHSPQLFPAFFRDRILTYIPCCPQTSECWDYGNAPSQAWLGVLCFKMHPPPPRSPEQCVTILKVERRRRGNQNEPLCNGNLSLSPRQWLTFISWLLWDFNWVLNSVNKLKAFSVYSQLMWALLVLSTYLCGEIVWVRCAQRLRPERFANCFPS